MAGQVKFVYKRGEGRLKLQRKFWSFRRKRHDGLEVLPPVRDQGQKNTCLYHAICVIIESKLRMKGISVKLSVDYLENISASISGSNERSLFSEVPRLLQKLISVGIYTEEDYKKGCLNGPSYNITGFKTLTWFKATTPSAIEELKKMGPLLAVIKVSRNYTSNFLSGVIYRFDNKDASVVGAQTRTHAVMTTGYVIENRLPAWEMMNSHGIVGEGKGFGCFDFDSLAALYSIDIEP